MKLIVIALLVRAVELKSYIYAETYPVLDD
jgi:hypothetical protein